MIVIANLDYMHIRHCMCSFILSYITNKGEDLETDRQREVKHDWKMVEDDSDEHVDHVHR